jgi:hypothetical protein
MIKSRRVFDMLAAASVTLKRSLSELMSVNVVVDEAIDSVARTVAELTFASTNGRVQK